MIDPISIPTGPIIPTGIASDGLGPSNQVIDAVDQIENQEDSWMTSTTPSSWNSGGDSYDVSWWQ